MSEVIKGKKRKKHKKNNVIPLKRDLQKESNTSNHVNFQEIEKDKINQYGRNLVKEIEEYSKQFRMAPSFF